MLQKMKLPEMKKTPPQTLDMLPRFHLGPRPISGMIDRLSRPTFKKQSPSGAQIMSQWSSIFPEYASATTPLKFSKQTKTLTIGCSSPQALELDHQKPALASRINGYLGMVLVDDIKFKNYTIPPSNAKQQQVKPTAVIPQSVTAAVASFDDDEMQKLFARLARAVYQKTA
jgi:hypothetical protein